LQLARGYGDALDSAQHVGAFAVTVIHKGKRIVIGLQERASAAQPNEPAFDGVVLTNLASVYRQTCVCALIEVHPGVFELVVSDEGSLGHERNRPRPLSTERLTQASQHREVGVKPHALRAPDAQRGGRGAEPEQWEMA
jgi:hypothetical protein